MNPAQNQNPNPDYGFIVNQPGPTSKKKMDIRVKIIIGLIVAMVIMIPIFFIINRAKDLSLSKSGQTAVDLTEAYLKDIEDQQYQVAYDYIDPGSGLKEEQFISIVGPAVRSGNDTANCQVTASDRADFAAEAVCSDREQASKITYLYEYSSETAKITKVTMIKRETIQS